MSRPVQPPSQDLPDRRPVHFVARVALGWIGLSALFVLSDPLFAQPTGNPGAPAPSSESVEQDDTEPPSALPARRLDEWPRLEPGDVISLVTRDASLKEILRAFARAGRFNLIVQPMPDTPVTVEFHEVQWERALEQILKMAGLTWEMDGKVFKVQKASRVDGPSSLPPAPSRRAVLD